MLNKAQIRPSLECSSQIGGAAAPTILSILDAVHRSAIRSIFDSSLTFHLLSLSHRRPVGDLLLFYRYSNRFSSRELTSIFPSLTESARCFHETSSSSPKTVVLQTSRTEWYDRTFASKVSRAWDGLPGNIFIEPASVGQVLRQQTSLNLTFLT
nr:unnamed protein product [Callosobruchus chinensis]